MENTESPQLDLKRRMAVILGYEGDFEAGRCLSAGADSISISFLAVSERGSDDVVFEGMLGIEKRVFCYFSISI